MRISAIFILIVWIGVTLLTPIHPQTTNQDVQTVEDFMQTITDLTIEEQIQAIFLRANQALLDEEYTLAIAFAEKAKSLAPKNNQVIANANSIIRIAQSYLDQPQTETNINWSTENNIRDRNRYLVLAGVSFDNFTLNWQDNPRYSRAGIGISLEAFLPYFSRQFGFALQYSSQFVNFAHPKISDDFIISRYNGFFVWRLNWRVPALEITTTVALKLGVSGLYIIPKAKFDADTGKIPGSYILPKFEVTLQDALLARFFPNPFTKNLLINLTLGLEWLPAHKTKESIAFEVSTGIFYSIGSFTIGPSYQFRYHRLIRQNQNLLHHRWSLEFTYTLL
ncbi:hypothetical protein PVA45_06625 [Entomospira entomophila]|uniref:Uncharacterized protein n=1 Tax=Entomospira entomophila TaxID=2719988 RepID=A0A968KRX9_9SPIO|nr:hypothetical protein [Entomospira entomophilus]NIZ41174.1 hypothetical protein [Entomospira entomophilus]WDI35381.1 hypothetical protein PVA45_06625 [Entomospira entomophilus]